MFRVIGCAWLIKVFLYCYICLDYNRQEREWMRLQPGGFCALLCVSMRI